MATKYVLSDHAKQRRKQMHVTEHQIEQAIADPDTTYPGPSGHPPGRTCYQRGPIVVVVDEIRVVTVLWHRLEGR